MSEPARNRLELIETTPTEEAPMEVGDVRELPLDPGPPGARVDSPFPDRTAPVETEPAVVNPTPFGQTEDEAAQEDFEDREATPVGMLSFEEAIGTHLQGLAEARTAREWGERRDALDARLDSEGWSPEQKDEFWHAYNTAGQPEPYQDAEQLQRERESQAREREADDPRWQKLDEVHAMLAQDRQERAELRHAEQTGWEVRRSFEQIARDHQARGHQAPQLDDVLETFRAAGIEPGKNFDPHTAVTMAVALKHYHDSMVSGRGVGAPRPGPQGGTWDSDPKRNPRATLTVPASGASSNRQQPDSPFEDDEREYGR